MILSHTAFVWFVTIMISSICLGWAIWDGRNLLRLWKTRKEDHDEFFGAIMGLVCVGIGLTGLIRYHLSL